MICKPCAVAADMQTILQDIEHPKKTKYRVKAIAELLHAQCKGCDCQHKLVERGKNVQQSVTLGRLDGIQR